MIGMRTLLSELKEMEDKKKGTLKEEEDEDEDSSEKNKQPAAAEVHKHRRRSVADNDDDAQDECEEHPQESRVRRHAGEHVHTLRFPESAEQTAQERLQREMQRRVPL